MGGWLWGLVLIVGCGFAVYWRLLFAFRWFVGLLVWFGVCFSCVGGLLALLLVLVGSFVVIVWAFVWC